MQFYTDNILLIFLLPLISAIISFAASIFKFSISKNTIIYCSLITAVIGVIFACALYFFYGYLLTEPVEFSVNWLRVGGLTISAGILFDNISSLFLLILMITNIIVQLYSATYLQQDKNFNLYFCFLNLFLVSMSGLILSSNIPQTYIFIELVSVCSYLLINFYYEKPQVSNAAKKVFIINRIGDTMFLAGIIILIYFISNYPISEGMVLLDYTDLSETAADFYVYLSDINFYFACLLLFGGAIAKSAQFPLHTWLVDAMHAPTPISALIHSATMVSAGILLTIRLMPLFELSAYVLNTIMYTGIITAFLCAFFAIGQTDIKKMLAYSTSSQIGLIFTVLGTSGTSAALFYMAVHSFSKALLFLIAGILIMFIAKGSQQITEISVKRKDYPLLALCYVIATISLSGLFFGGYSAKEAILEQLISVNQIPVIILFITVIFMTSYYLFRSYFIIFEGDETYKDKVKIPLSINFSLIILTCVIILTSFYNKSLSGNTLKIFQVIPSTVLVSFTAIILACFTSANKKQPLPVILKKISFNGGYISNFYDWITENIIDFFRNFTKSVDKYIIDAFVNFQGYIARFLSWCISVGQTGNIQTYISYAVISTAILLFLYLLLIIGFGAI